MVRKLFYLAQNIRYNSYIICLVKSVLYTRFCHLTIFDLLTAKDFLMISTVAALQDLMNNCSFSMHPRFTNELETYNLPKLLFGYSWIGILLGTGGCQVESNLTVILSFMCDESHGATFGNYGLVTIFCNMFSGVSWVLDSSIFST
ncbi:hypothetical protein ACJX0J_023450, partial [Zea mays]